MQAYKVLTHDLRPPIQGGEALFDGQLPYVLPTVKVDTSAEECAAGWNACAEAHTALRLAGLWPNGRPSRLFIAEAPDMTVITRQEKLRAPSWTLTCELSEEEIATHVRRLSEPFGDLADEMRRAQMAWREALSRPEHNDLLAEQFLALALQARKLDWQLRRFDNAWAARDAWAALTVYYAAARQWIDYAPDLLTVGIRDAYFNGLELAIPTGPNELGWVMS